MVSVKALVSTFGPIHGQVPLAAVCIEDTVANGRHEVHFRGAIDIVISMPCI